MALRATGDADGARARLEAAAAALRPLGSAAAAERCRALLLLALLSIDDDDDGAAALDDAWRAGAEAATGGGLAAARSLLNEAEASARSALVPPALEREMRLAVAMAGGLAAEADGGRALVGGIGAALRRQIELNRSNNGDLAEAMEGLSLAAPAAAADADGWMAEPPAGCTVSALAAAPEGRGLLVGRWRAGEPPLLLYVSTADDDGDDDDDDGQRRRRG